MADEISAAHRSDMPPEIEWIFRRMVSKRLEDRYQRTTELVADSEMWRNAGGKL